MFKYDTEAFGSISRDTFVAALEAEGVPCDGRFYEDLTQSPLLEPGHGRYPAWDAANPPQPCPTAARAAYEEAVWLPHQIFLGTSSDVQDVVEALDKISRNVEALRGTEIEALARTSRP